jgi:hypothetical protein
MAADGQVDLKTAEAEEATAKAKQAAADKAAAEAAEKETETEKAAEEAAEAYRKAQEELQKAQGNAAGQTTSDGDVTMGSQAAEAAIRAAGTAAQEAEEKARQAAEAAAAAAETADEAAKAAKVAADSVKYQSSEVEGKRVELMNAEQRVQYLTTRAEAVDSKYRTLLTSENAAFKAVDDQLVKFYSKSESNFKDKNVQNETLEALRKAQELAYERQELYLESNRYYALKDKATAEKENDRDKAENAIKRAGLFNSYPLFDPDDDNGDAISKINAFVSQWKGVMTKDGEQIKSSQKFRWFHMLRRATIINEIEFLQSLFGDDLVNMIAVIEAGVEALVSAAAGQSEKATEKARIKAMADKLRGVSFTVPGGDVYGASLTELSDMVGRLDEGAKVFTSAS